MYLNFITVTYSAICPQNVCTDALQILRSVKMCRFIQRFLHVLYIFKSRLLQYYCIVVCPVEHSENEKNSQIYLNIAHQLSKQPWEYLLVCVRDFEHVEVKRKQVQRLTLSSSLSYL